MLISLQKFRIDVAILKISSLLNPKIFPNMNVSLFMPQPVKNDAVNVTAIPVAAIFFNFEKFILSSFLPVSIYVLHSHNIFQNSINTFRNMFCRMSYLRICPLHCIAVKTMFKHIYISKTCSKHNCVFF